MKKHVSSFHQQQKTSKESFDCEKCDKTYSSYQCLTNHVAAVHEGVKIKKCDYCQKEFSKKSELKKHIAEIHKEEKNHKCNHCEKSFREPRTLMAHINMVPFFNPAARTV